MEPRQPFALGSGGPFTFQKSNMARGNPPFIDGFPIVQDYVKTPLSSGNSQLAMFDDTGGYQPSERRNTW